MRTVLQTPFSWSLSEESIQFYDIYLRQLAEASPQCGQRSSSQGIEFKELALRFAMLLSIVDLCAKDHFPQSFIVEEKAMRTGGLLAWWAAQEHAECLSWLHESEYEAVDEMEDVANLDNVDSQELSSAILDRLTSNGSMSRRDLSRSFHKLPSKVRDQAIRMLLKEGLIAESDDGAPLGSDLPLLDADNDSVSVWFDDLGSGRLEVASTAS